MRLVGISQGVGITIGERKPYSRQERARVPAAPTRDAIVKAVSAWSGFKTTEKAELGDACKSVIKAAKCGADDFAALVLWIEEHKGGDFFAAVK